MVNERVGAGNWDSGAELGDTWAARNSFSFGRGGERGTARPEVLQGLLATCDRVVQEIDSVEYGLTDIQEYYANTGGWPACASTDMMQAGARWCQALGSGGFRASEPVIASPTERRRLEC